MLGQFHAFDRPYLERLRLGDVPTQVHFADYFERLIRMKLRGRLNSKSAIEDVRQETFLRVWIALRRDRGIRQPERFGAFVMSVCNNVLREYERKTFKLAQAEDDLAVGLRKMTLGAVEIVEAYELRRQVTRLLAELTATDRELLRKIFVNELNRDEVSRDFGVSRQYLRVLLHRALRQFRKVYLEDIGANDRRRGQGRRTRVAWPNRTALVPLRDPSGEATGAKNPDQVPGSVRKLDRTENTGPMVPSQQDVMPTLSGDC